MIINVFERRIDSHFYSILGMKFKKRRYTRYMYSIESIHLLPYVLHTHVLALEFLVYTL